MSKKDPALPCKHCKKRVKISVIIRKADQAGTTQARCPHCGHLWGEVTC